MRAFITLSLSRQSSVSVQKGFGKRDWGSCTSTNTLVLPGMNGVRSISAMRLRCLRVSRLNFASRKSFGSRLLGKIQLRWFVPLRFRQF